MTPFMDDGSENSEQSSSHSCELNLDTLGEEDDQCPTVLSVQQDRVVPLATDLAVSAAVKAS